MNASLYLSTSVTFQPRQLSCNQSEARMLVSDWLQLVGFGWVAAEVDMYEPRLQVVKILTRN